MHEQLRIARYFNSRPSARGDPCCVGCLQGHNDFNSRPSARGDIDIPEHDVKAGISIHAPPRGATTATAVLSISYLFQFTPLREGRHGQQEVDEAAATFQFTPLREGRRKAC